MINKIYNFYTKSTKKSCYKNLVIESLKESEEKLSIEFAPHQRDERDELKECDVYDKDVSVLFCSCQKKDGSRLYCINHYRLPNEQIVLNKKDDNFLLEVPIQESITFDLDTYVMVLKKENKLIEKRTFSNDELSVEVVKRFICNAFNVEYEKDVLSFFNPNDIVLLHIDKKSIEAICPSWMIQFMKEQKEYEALQKNGFSIYADNLSEYIMPICLSAIPMAEGLNVFKYACLYFHHPNILSYEMDLKQINLAFNSANDVPTAKTLLLIDSILDEIFQAYLKMFQDNEKFLWQSFITSLTLVPYKSRSRFEQEITFLALIRKVSKLQNVDTKTCLQVWQKILTAHFASCFSKKMS